MTFWKRITATFLLATISIFLFACSDVKMETVPDHKTASTSEAVSNEKQESPTNEVLPDSAEDETGQADFDEISQAQILLKLHTIDVGQGDSIFIELPDGSTLLIDAGLAKYGSTVVKYIKDLGYRQITMVVGTHPDADHIGGLAEVIRSFSVGSVYMPKAESTTKTYISLLQTIKEKNLKIKRAKAGVVMSDSAGCKVEIISPVKDTYKDSNSYSAVLKLTYGQHTFLLMGDATTENEAEITADVKADWIKIAHHGSKTSSSAAFVRKVKARYGVISVGEGNSYGLPKDEILKRYADVGTQLYRTDECGTIRTYSNGKVLLNEFEKTSRTVSPKNVDTDTVDTAGQQQWLLNTNTKVIHRPACSAVKRMAEKNKKTSTETIAQLTAQGYKCCGICNPED